MSVADKGVAELYELRDSMSTASKAVDEYLLARNPTVVARTDAAVAAVPAEAAPLPGTQAIVEDGDTYAVTGGEILVSVADGVPEFTFVPE